METHRFILISGCSGGGKSTLLDALGQRGYAVVEEPGRRIVEQETRNGGSALPWTDMRAFARRAIELSRSDLTAAARFSGTVFFDRGLVDAAVALEHCGGVPVRETLGQARHYGTPVFLAPPWPEIYAADESRRHGFVDAKAEFERLVAAFPSLGYETVILPKLSVGARISFIEHLL